MNSSTRPGTFIRGTLLGMLIGGAAAAGGFLAGSGETLDSLLGRTPPPSSEIVHHLGGGELPAPLLASDTESPGQTIAEIAAHAMPSVVNISTKRTLRTSSRFDDRMLRFWGIPREREESSLGSGVIVSESGVVLTNNHVVEHADEIFVTLADGKQTYRAELVGSDPSSDLAVLRLPEGIRDLRPIALGDSNRLRVGDWVIAVGNPFGVGQTVTHGIVSALGRSNVGINEYEDFIQTDAPINPGNSGGALINMEGELVGINTAILSKSGGSQGIGFAIPSNMVKPIADSIVKNGELVRGWLGVTTSPLDQERALDLGRTTTEGVLISDVAEGSPAAEAGLQPGDLLLTLNAQELKSPEQLRGLIATYGAGSEVSFGVWREGVIVPVQARLGELGDALASVDSITLEEGDLQGATVAALDDATREEFEIDQRVKGVVVTEVEARSVAHLKGVQAGDVIVSVNGSQLGSLAEFQSAYTKSTRGFDVRIYRRGMTLSFSRR